MLFELLQRIQCRLGQGLFDVLFSSTSLTVGAYALVLLDSPPHMVPAKPPPSPTFPPFSMSTVVSGASYHTHASSIESMEIEADEPLPSAVGVREEDAELPDLEIPQHLYCKLAESVC